METWATFLHEPRLRDPKFSSRQGRTQYAEDLLALVQGKLSEWKARDFMKEAMDQRLVVGVVQSPEEVLNCPHLAARGDLVGLERPEEGTLLYPGPGFLIDGVNPMLGGRGAPRLGEHNAAIYGGVLGFSGEELAMLRGAGVI